MVVSSIFAIAPVKSEGSPKILNFFPSGLFSMHFNGAYFKHKNTSMQVLKSLVLAVGAKDKPLLSAEMHVSVRGLDEKFIIAECS